VPPAPAAPAALTAERLQLLRTYKAQRIGVRAETELRGGGTSFGWASPRYGPSVMMSDPLYTVRTWGLYQGSERLSTPSALALMGERARHDALTDQIQRGRRVGTTFFVAGGLGAAAMLGGIVASQRAPTEEALLLASQVTTIGALAGVGGVVIGSFPSARASRLERYPSATMPREEAQRLAAAHNERLRLQLGLSPAEVWMLEVGADE
jgi:hypothetical protein